MTRLVTPAGWSVLLGSAAVYALGVGLGYPSLVAIGLAGLLAFAVAVAAVLVRPRLRVERAVAPDRVTVGEPALGQVSTRNLSRWPAPGFVVVDRLGGEPLELPVPGLPGTGTRTVHYPVPTRRRGALPLGPITVDRLDPLGLLRRPQATGRRRRCGCTRGCTRREPLPVGVVLDYEGRLADSAPARHGDLLLAARVRARRRPAADPLAVHRAHRDADRPRARRHQRADDHRGAGHPAVGAGRCGVRGRGRGGRVGGGRLGAARPPGRAARRSARTGRRSSGPARPGCSTGWPRPGRPRRPRTTRWRCWTWSSGRLRAGRWWW